MNDEIKEYDLPEFKGDNEIPSEEPPVDEPVSELPHEEPVIAELTEGTVFEEPEAVVEIQPPSKFQVLVHKIAVWALGILSLALLVYLLFYFLMYRPLRLEHDTLTSTNETLESELSDTREDLDTLTTQYSEVTVLRDTLLADNGLYQGYVHFLNLKNDMLLLQKAYLEEDNEAAALALNKTNRDLESFSNTLQGADETLAEVIFAKVALLTTVDEDQAANIEEVETIYDFLLEMEDDLYGGLE